MKAYTYDIWEGDKGIIFANSEEEAIKMYEQAYPDNPIYDCDYVSGACSLDYLCEVPNEPWLKYMYN